MVKSERSDPEKDKLLEEDKKIGINVETHGGKKKLFLKLSKIINISGERYQQNRRNTQFDHHGRTSLNEMHVKEELRCHCLLIIRQYPSRYKKQRRELVDCKNYQPCRRFSKRKSSKKNYWSTVEQKNHLI